MLDVIGFTALLLFGYWYWQQAQQFKAIALRATKSRCTRLELLLLDDYVAFSRLGLRKNAAGRWQVFRCYTFEFASTGEERYRGVCTLLGDRVLSIEMETYRADFSD
jgi:hypothetical protein